MQHVVRVETLVSVIPTAVVRRRANQRDLAKVVPEACGIVWRALRAGQVQGAGRHVAFYLDGQNNLEVGVELAAPLPGDANLSDAVVASALPIGTVAATTHLGPYPQLHHAHVAILGWCTAHGYTRAGPNWEIYGHWEDAWNADPSQIRTDVYYLLRTPATPAD